MSLASPKRSVLALVPTDDRFSSAPNIQRLYLACSAPTPFRYFGASRIVGRCIRKPKWELRTDCVTLWAEAETRAECLLRG